MRDGMMGGVKWLCCHAGCSTSNHVVWQVLLVASQLGSVQQNRLSALIAHALTVTTQAMTAYC